MNMLGNHRGRHHASVCISISRRRPACPLSAYLHDYLIPVFTAILLLLQSGISHSQPREYNFGVFPYIPPEKVEQVWSPLIAQISQQLNKKINLRTRASYSTFRASIENEDFDIAFMQPFVYANIAARHNYIPLARFVSLRDKKRVGMLRAIFVTLKENQNLKISDLRGKTIATPPITAAVTLLGKELLLEHGLVAGKDYKISTQINHHSCLRQLIINKPIACITAHPPYSRFNPVTNNRLAIMTSSKAIPSSLIAIHKRVNDDDRQTIKNILLNLKNSRYTKSFLKKAQLTDFIETRDSDYDVVREMWKRINKENTYR